MKGDFTNESSRAGQRRPEQTGAEALAWVSASGQTETLVARLQALGKQKRRRRRRVIAGSLALALVFAGGLASWRSRAPEKATEAPALVVSTPEKRALPDGSTLEIAPGAEVEVVFTPAERRVVLRRGQAHFAVAKDSGRPFAVQAGEVVVRALGTAFAVEIAATAVEVVVTEGTVAVAAQEPTGGNARPGAAPLAIVEAGRRVSVPTGAAVVHVEEMPAEEQSRRLAWRAPWLRLSGHSLAHVADLFNLHAKAQGGPRVVVPSDLGGLRVSGNLRADDLDSLLLLLRHEFGVTSVERGGEVFLRRQ